MYSEEEIQLGLSIVPQLRFLLAAERNLRSSLAPAERGHAGFAFGFGGHIASATMSSVSVSTKKGISNRMRRTGPDG
jgi:hypothetical protein